MSLKSLYFLLLKTDVKGLRHKVFILYLNGGHEEVAMVCKCKTSKVFVHCFGYAFFDGSPLAVE